MILATRPSRRHLLRALAGGAIAAAATGLGVRDSLAKRLDRDASARRAGRRPKPARRPKPVPAQRPKVRGFAAEANQTVTEAAVAGCQFPTGPTGGLCTTTFSGTGTAAHLGEVTVTSTLTADWSQAINTGPDGFCAPITGSATLQAVATSKQNRGPLPLQITGTVCETSADGDSYPLVFTGQYTIVESSGRYANATGGGTVNGAIESPGGVGATASFAAEGQIRF